LSSINAQPATSTPSPSPTTLYHHHHPKLLFPDRRAQPLDTPKFTPPSQTAVFVNLLGVEQFIFNSEFTSQQPNVNMVYRALRHYCTRYQATYISDPTAYERRQKEKEERRKMTEEIRARLRDPEKYGGLEAASKGHRVSLSWNPPEAKTVELSRAESKKKRNTADFASLQVPVVATSESSGMGSSGASTRATTPSGDRPPSPIVVQTEAIINSMPFPQTQAYDLTTLSGNSAPNLPLEMLVESVDKTHTSDSQDEKFIQVPIQAPEPISTIKSVCLDDESGNDTPTQEKVLAATEKVRARNSTPSKEEVLAAIEKIRNHHRNMGARPITGRISTEHKGPTKTSATTSEGDDMQGRRPSTSNFRGCAGTPPPSGFPTRRAIWMNPRPTNVRKVSRETVLQAPPNPPREVNCVGCGNSLWGTNAHQCTFPTCRTLVCKSCMELLTSPESKGGFDGYVPLLKKSIALLQGATDEEALQVYKEAATVWGMAGPEDDSEGLRPRLKRGVATGAAWIQMNAEKYREQQEFKDRWGAPRD
jgi:predicted RNase H-like HicB family nuclease